MTLVSRANLRRELERQLMTDGDLDAFCIDHFPLTYRTFSSGMNRQQKINLLLSRESPEQIAQVLGIIAHTPTSGGISKAGPYSAATRSPLHVVVIALLGLMLGPIAINRALAPSGTNDALILNSSPNGARILDKRTGHQLGTTPWHVGTKFYGQVVCIEKAGYRPEVINLSKTQTSEQMVILFPIENSTNGVCDVPIPIP